MIAKAKHLYLKDLRKSSLCQKYLEYRAKGYTAKSAFASAKEPERPAIDWRGLKGYNAKAELTVGKYVVRLEQHTDNDPDLSWLGEYHPRHGCINREKRGDMRRGECQYWIPARADTEADRKEYHRQGMDKNTAYEKARQIILRDYARHEAYNNDEWWMIGIVAKAYLVDSIAGIEIECGEASLWGIESDSEDYHDVTAWELIDQAVAEADSHRLELIEQRAKEIVALTA